MLLVIFIIYQISFSATDYLSLFSASLVRPPKIASKVGFFDVFTYAEQELLGYQCIKFREVFGHAGTNF